MSRCVALMVVSDEPSFLGIWTQQALEGGLLAWPTLLIVLTGLPLLRLTHIRDAFSQANAAIIISEGGDFPK